MSISVPRTATRRERGATFVLWLVAMVPLLGVTALALDVNNLFVASRELRNAADAGALEGATHLYNADGTAIQRSTVIAQATAAATANLSRGTAAEVASVQIGHWRFNPAGGGEFTPTESDTVISLFGKPFYDPDNPTSCNNLNNACSGDINAVRVVTERNATPVQSFFGSVLGLDDYPTSAAAVAYLGFAGDLYAGDVGQPLAICAEAITNDDGTFTCSKGLYISGEQTGLWTDLDQDRGCGGGSADTSDMVYMTCSGEGSQQSIQFGAPVPTQVGVAVGQPFDAVYACWKSDPHRCRPTATPAYGVSGHPCTLNDPAVKALPNPTTPWDTTLTVISCTAPGYPASCKPTAGVAPVTILHIVKSHSDEENDAPGRATCIRTPPGCVTGTAGCVTNCGSMAFPAIGTNLATRDADSDDIMDASDSEWNAPMPTVAAPDPSTAYGQLRWNSFAAFYNLRDSSNNLIPWNNTIQKTVFYAPNCEPQIPRGTTQTRNYGIRAQIPVLVN